MIVSAWIEQIFDAGQVARGNVVRRCVHDVEKYASFSDLLGAVKSRGFHMAVIGDQCVVLCCRNLDLT